MLATNEKRLLRKTLNTIIEVCGTKDIAELVLIVPSRDCPAAQVCAEYGGRLCGVKIRMYIQKNKDKILFFSEVPCLAKSSHFVIMAADMEMDPHSLREMLKIAKENPKSIVCAAKWLPESEITGYGAFHRVANIAVNRAAAQILRVPYKDLFSIYQIYPKTVLEQMHFQNMKKLLFEYTLKPVASGVKYIEIPTAYHKRTEEKPNTDFLLFCKLGILFLQTAIKLRFSKSS